MGGRESGGAAHLEDSHLGRLQGELLVARLSLHGHWSGRGAYLARGRLDGAVRVEILAEDVDDILLAEDGAEGLVLAAEAEADQAIPLNKVDGRRLPPRSDADYRGFDFGRRFEVVFADFDEVLHVGKERGIH